MVPVTSDLDELDCLALDLELDHVVTAWQVRRWYKKSQAELEENGFLLERRYVKPTRSSHRPREVAFVMLDAKYRAHSDVSLYHLAGTAEIRYALGAGYVFGGDQEWSSSAWRESATMVPDGLWERPDGTRIAIEFDATHYSNSRVREKTERFAEFDGQVWGAPTETRVAALRGLVSEVDSRALVVLANPLIGR